MSTVLVIDDEKIILEMAKDILDYLGYEVLEAENSNDAIKILSVNLDKIDAIILDMNLGVEDGEEVFIKIKDLYVSRNLIQKCKVIISTGFSKNEKIEKLIEMGVTDYIQKPYKIQDLSDLLDKVLAY